MSIVTLKRKTQTKYNNMSVNAQNGFSINGTRRSQGYVGQTSLSRSLTRTLMRGNSIRGTGGCCGNYIEYPIVKSCVDSLNNKNIVKGSVLGTRGMLTERLDKNPCNTVPKPSYISNNRRTCIDTSSVNGSSCVYKPVIIPNCVSRCKNKTVRESYTKPLEFYNTMPSSDYITHVRNRLAQQIILTYVPVSGNLNRGEPFGC